MGNSSKWRTLNLAEIRRQIINMPAQLSSSKTLPYLSAEQTNENKKDFGHMKYDLVGMHLF